jgi:hypothetical protein
MQQGISKEALGQHKAVCKVLVAPAAATGPASAGQLSEQQHAAVSMQCLVQHEK